MNFDIGAADVLKELEDPYKRKIVSARGTPDSLFEYVGGAEVRGIRLVIAEVKYPGRRYRKGAEVASIRVIIAGASGASLTYGGGQDDAAGVPHPTELLAPLETTKPARASANVLRIVQDQLEHRCFLDAQGVPQAGAAPESDAGSLRLAPERGGHGFRHEHSATGNAGGPSTPVRDTTLTTLDPIILFFLLGLAAGLLRSELRLPAAVYELVSILLLLAIGLKGGVELAKQPFNDLLPQMLAVVALGCVLPLVAFPVLYFVGRFKRADAASIAAHYGSVSVGTYAVAAAYFASRQITFEAHMPLLLALLEIPAILVGIFLAHGVSRKTRLATVVHEVFLGKSIVLLVGGLLIGWAAGPEGLASIKPLFFDLFKGILALFLLEMGLIAAAQFGSLRQYGVFLVLFGIGMPLFSAVVGGVLGWLLGLSLGGTAMLATMAASASYIAVPAAIRISVPEANPTLSLAASLGVTFPFNVVVGIPLYYGLAVRLHAILGG